MQKDYDLSDRTGDDVVDFLREMFNLSTLVRQLANELDNKKVEELDKIKRASNGMLSLHTPGSHPPARSQNMTTISEGDEDNSNDGQIFNDPQVQSVLAQMNCRINFVNYEVGFIFHDCLPL